MAAPALTLGDFRTKGMSMPSDAIAFHGQDIRVSISPRPSYYAPAGLASEHVAPVWFVRTAEALNHLLQLPSNWNGYGAAEVQEHVAQRALLFLVDVMDSDAPPPSAVPLTDGGLQFEWHRRGRNLEIEFPAGDSPTFFYYENDTDIEIEGTVSKNQDRIESFITTLK